MSIKISNVFSFHKCKDIILLQHPVAICKWRPTSASFTVANGRFAEFSGHQDKKTFCRERLITWVAYDRLLPWQSNIFAALPLCHNIICDEGSCLEHRGIMSSCLAARHRIAGRQAPPIAAILLSNLCLADFQITGMSLCEVLRHSIPPHDSLIIKRWLELIRKYRIF